MGKVSIVKRKDGGLCISPIVREQRLDESDAEFLHTCTKRITEEPLSPGFGGEVIGIFDDSIVIQDRYFRNAWTWETPDPVIDINMTEARKIHMAVIREKRNKKLQELDGETMKAITNPQRLAEIESQKQALRDIPETIKPQLDAAITADELLKIQPV